MPSADPLSRHAGRSSLTCRRSRGGHGEVTFWSARRGVGHGAWGPSETHPQTRQLVHRLKRGRALQQLGDGRHVELAVTGAVRERVPRQRRHAQLLELPANVPCATPLLLGNELVPLGDEPVDVGQGLAVERRRVVGHDKALQRLPVLAGRQREREVAAQCELRVAQRERPSERQKLPSERRTDPGNGAEPHVRRPRSAVLASEHLVFPGKPQAVWVPCLRDEPVSSELMA